MFLLPHPQKSLQALGVCVQVDKAKVLAFRVTLNSYLSSLPEFALLEIGGFLSLFQGDYEDR